jgi:uncharacterized protein (TIGR01777 family)
MRIVIPGGSGQVGTLLARHFHAGGHEVIVLSRSPAKPPAVWKTIAWDLTVIDGSDIVINLAGRNVNCRYTPANRSAILESRVETTRAIGNAIVEAKRPPSLWLQASTATIYAYRFDAGNDETTGIIGGGESDAPAKWKFSIDVARQWEQAAESAVTPDTRKVLMRSALTLSPDRGGIFDVLLGLVRHGLGGKSGSGRQFVSWIHDHDFVGAVEFLIAREDLAGPVNICAPNPVPNAEFMRDLRTAWGAPIGLPAAEWMLAIGAVLMQTETELILKSRRVVPGRLSDAGFESKFPEWKRAAVDLCERWKSGHR